MKLREEFERLIVQVSTYEKGTIPFKCAFDSIIAEFDRLKAENERLKVGNRELSDCLGDSDRREKTLQSWLDKISLPMSKFRKGEMDSADAMELECEAITHSCLPWKPSEKPNHISCTDKLPENMFNTYDGIYHVSRRGTKHFCSVQDCSFCNPLKCEHKNGGISYYDREGVLKQWCADCKEWVKTQKPLTLCTECKGAMAVEQMDACPRCKPTHFEYYWFQCPTCSGQGVVPKETW